MFIVADLVSLSAKMGMIRKCHSYKAGNINPWHFEEGIRTQAKAITQFKLKKPALSSIR